MLFRSLTRFTVKRFKRGIAPTDGTTPGKKFLTKITKSFWNTTTLRTCMAAHPHRSMIPEHVRDTDFEAWYTSFGFEKDTKIKKWDAMEVVPNCKLDVRIQCLGAQRHRRLFFECSKGVDPFCGSFPTLACVLAHVFAKHVRLQNKSHVQPCERLGHSNQECGGRWKRECSGPHI